MKTITFHYVTGKAYNRILNFLDKLIKPDVEEMVVSVLSTFRNYKKILVDKNDKPVDMDFFNTILKTVNTNKTNLLKFMAMFFSDERNFRRFVSEKGKEYEEVCKKCLTEYFVTLEDAEKLIKKPIVFKKSNRYNRDTISNDLPFIFALYDQMYDNWNGRVLLYIDSSLRSLFWTVLFPSDGELHQHEKLPKDIVVKNFERSSIISTPILESLIQQNKIELSGYKMSATLLKKIVKMLSTEEFFDNEKSKDVASLRNSIIVQTMSIFCKSFSSHYRKLKDEESHEKIKNMHEKISIYRYFLYPILLPFITGLRSTIYPQINGGDLILSILNGTMTSGMLRKWVSVDDLIEHEFLSNGNASSLEFMNIYLFNRLKLVNKLRAKRSMDELQYTDLFKDMGLVFVRCYLFYLASWGLLEVGLEPEKNTYVPYYERLKYIRMTGLGAYVFGLTNKYEPPKIEEKAHFELDPERLILRSLGDDNLYESLLTDTCISIGNHRYEMNAQTFLAHCLNKTDVESKIKFFKQYISGDLPPIWENFFQTLVQHCKPLLPVPITMYRILKIDPENKPLIRLLSSDPKLKQLVKRAEDFMIIVKNDDYTKFTNRLKALGYLL